MPIFLECQRCGECCRWPGQVRLTNEEISELARFKGLSEFEFIQQFTRLASDRRGLALVEQPGGSCVFLEGIECAVQAVKPRQCCGFPNRWSFAGSEKVCRAVPREVSPAEFEQLVKTNPVQRGWSLLISGGEC